MPDIGVSSSINTGKKSLRAFEVRLRVMNSEIVEIILKSIDILPMLYGIVDNTFPWESKVDYL